MKKLILFAGVAMNWSSKFATLPIWAKIFIFYFFWWLLIPLRYILPKIKSRNNRVAFAVGWFGIFVPLLILLPNFIFAIGLISPDDITNSSEVAGVIDKNNDEELQSALKQAQEEEAKRLALEEQISQSQTINPDISFDDAGIEEELQDQTTTLTANQSIANLGYNTQNSKSFDVLSIVDGDTIKVSELGTLRLIGMDTPETKDPRKPVQCFGAEATKRANEILSGQKVYLEFDPANRIDKYGRTLAYVFRTDGLFFNTEMIREGYAHSYTKYPHPRLQEFNQAQSQAQSRQSGLWNPGTCNGDTQQAAVQPQPASAPTPSPAPQQTQTTVSPAPTPAPQPQPTPSFVYDHSGNNYNCGDFDTWAQANQAFQESLKAVGYDIHRLDGNTTAVENGIPCESLPGSPI